MGKTETIRQRRVDVWVPSLEEKEAWKQAAKEQGLSLSKLIIQLVNQSINDQAVVEDVDALKQRVVDLEAELGRRERRIEDLERLKDRLDQELNQYRSQDFLTSPGIKQLDPRLINVLSTSRDDIGRSRVVTETELMQRLRLGDSADDVQALAMQLEALELHGVVTATGQGWVWNA